jgi:hypothetical protein
VIEDGELWFLLLCGICHSPTIFIDKLEILTHHCITIPRFQFLRLISSFLCLRSLQFRSPHSLIHGITTAGTLATRSSNIMAPPSAIEPQNGDERKANTTAPLEPGLDEKRGKIETLQFPKPPKFDDPYKERAYLKGRLAAAFRIFGKFGFDEGVAGHITLRVSIAIDEVYLSKPDRAY